MNIQTWLYQNEPVLSVTSSEDPLVRKIVGFMTLPKGWHYGEGRAPTVFTVVHALSVAAEFRNLGAEEVEAFPEVHGELLISAYYGNVCIDASLRRTGLIDYVVTEKDEEIEAGKGRTLQELTRRIEERKWLPGNLSGWSTRSTIAKSRVDSNRLLSRTQTVPAFRWSMNAA